jgi:hypothetical protein
MCSFKFFNQNVCTVNVHEMYYKFNPGPSLRNPDVKVAHEHYNIREVKSIPTDAK